MKWISVKNKLPEFMKRVMVFSPTNKPNNRDITNIFIGYKYKYPMGSNFNGNDIFRVRGGGYCVRNCTHWQPLPEPPEQAKLS